jgi:hypothetical protein
MPQFTLRPPVVEAHRVDRDNVLVLAQRYHLDVVVRTSADLALKIRTPTDGVLFADVGDWLVEESLSGFHHLVVLSDATFHERYEPVPGGEPFIDEAHYPEPRLPVGVSVEEG